MGSPLLSDFERHVGALPAIEDDVVRWSHAELREAAERARAALCHGGPSLEGQRLVLLASPGAAWIAVFLGILRAGGVAVPLSAAYPPSELAWFAQDAGASAAVVSDDLRERAQSFPCPVLSPDDLLRPRAPSAPAAIDGGATAVLLYTSGTTGKPKGAMLTHDNLAMHTRLLRDAWGCTQGDRLLHALPLHHLHGLGIALLTILGGGGSARMLPRFDARRVWDELGAATVWMGVPTMYQKLFEAFDAGSDDERARWGAAARRLRLATSGSAALPVTLAERWRALTGAIPLERFGMTEIGVGMSNPLAPSERRPGYVGRPLPTVEARIIADGGESELGPGELRIKGPSVFAGYWGQPEATEAAFAEGWFRTGDIAERAPDRMIRLLGRTSIDILKSGGYKLSALEIEEVLREHGAIREVAVVGVPDATWGDRVVAVVVPVPGRECSSDALRGWAKERLASYKVPREFVFVDALPRNPMGKVVKPEIVARLGAPKP